MCVRTQSNLLISAVMVITSNSFCCIELNTRYFRFFLTLDFITTYVRRSRRLELHIHISISKKKNYINVTVSKQARWERALRRIAAEHTLEWSRWNHNSWKKYEESVQSMHTNGLECSFSFLPDCYATTASKKKRDKKWFRMYFESNTKTTIYGNHWSLIHKFVFVQT